MHGPCCFLQRPGTHTCVFWSEFSCWKFLPKPTKLHSTGHLNLIFVKIFDRCIYILWAGPVSFYRVESENCQFMGAAAALVHQQRRPAGHTASPPPPSEMHTGCNSQLHTLQSNAGCSFQKGEMHKRRGRTGKKCFCGLRDKTSAWAPLHPFTHHPYCPQSPLTVIWTTSFAAIAIFNKQPWLLRTI